MTEQQSGNDPDSTIDRRASSAFDQRNQVPDQRHGGILTPTLARLVVSEPPRTLADLVDRTRRSVDESTETRCMNPDCATRVKYPGDGAKTRPAAYCSARCRRQAEHVRARLRNDLEALESYQDLPGTARERREITRAISIRRWLLLRYRS